MILQVNSLTTGRWSACAPQGQQRHHRGGEMARDALQLIGPFLTMVNRIKFLNTAINPKDLF